MTCLGGRCVQNVKKCGSPLFQVGSLRSADAPFQVRVGRPLAVRVSDSGRRPGRLQGLRPTGAPPAGLRPSGLRPLAQPALAQVGLPDRYLWPLIRSSDRSDHHLRCSDIAGDGGAPCPAAVKRSDKHGAVWTLDRRRRRAVASACRLRKACRHVPPKSMSRAMTVGDVGS
jgi:hypothetical protein